MMYIGGCGGLCELMFVYVHVPFCRSRCVYCDFYVVLEKHGGTDEGGDVYLAALLKELAAKQAKVTDQGTLQSVYIGGGTPSLLPAKTYGILLEALNAQWPITAESEITLELNPEAVVDDLAHYRAVGFNRVSVGVQSFQDNELKKLSRIHSSTEAISCIHALQKAGFENISLDLMYGIPCQTEASWQATLETVLSLGVTHLSLYGLKIEETTPLARLVQSGAYPLPEDETTVQLYHQANSLLEAHGYHRYEFSNFAQPGCESKHNLNYWDMGNFLSLGVSASGYQDGVLQESVRSLEAYLGNPLALAAETIYTQREQWENQIIFGLRKRDGISISQLSTQWDSAFHKRFIQWKAPWLEKGLLQEADDRLSLTLAGIPLSNSILSELLTSP